MSRKPVIELAAKGKSYGRQAMWEAMRAKRSFTYADLHQWNHDTVRDYVRRLVAGGYLTADRSGGQFRRVVFTLVRDVGLEAPKLQKDGCASLQGQGREHMWRAMKMLASFNVVDLTVNASTEEVQVAEGEARDYVKHLERAKYLVIVKPATPTSKAVYRLVRNTGPRPPMVTRAKIVFDPNLGKVAWCEEVEP